MSTKRDALISALLVCITEAPEAKRNALAQTVEDYARTYKRTFNDAIDYRHNRLLAELLDAIVEGSDARPGIEDQL